MARERLVTRTIEVMDYLVLAVNMSTMMADQVTVSVPSAGTMSGKKKDEAIRKAMPEGFTFVQTMSESKREVLYVMSEEEFIKHAKVQEGGR